MSKTQKSHNNFLLLISFVAGLSIMGIEISASRLLAPYFGTSIFVWTNIIGIVLIALSLGYYYGGKFADRHPKLRVLLYPLLIAGLVFLITPFATKPLANLVTINILTIKSATATIFISSFFVTLLLFAFPIFLLGMVSPFVIRIYDTDHKHLGQMAGKIFAVSTLGSIIGTFLPTLWLIPTFGTRLTILIFAAILILTSSFGLIKKKINFAIVVLILIPILATQNTTLKVKANILYEAETPYQFVQVYENVFLDRYLLFNEGAGVQSIYKKEGILSGLYYDYFLPLTYLLDDSDKKEIVIIGLAGGTLSRELDHYFGDEIHIDGVEIDKKIIEIAREYFELDRDSLTVHNQDGHLFLSHAEKTYDLIVVDAYSQQLYIPWTMTTQEFWQNTMDVLSENGILALNINSTSEETELYQAISNTIASVFPHTYLSKVELGGGFNYIITASKQPLALDSLRELTTNQELLPVATLIAQNSKEIKFDPQKPILTNDRAPIEFMTDTMLFQRALENL